MATDAENLATARSAILAKLAESATHSKPTYNIDGQNVQWSEYRKSLWDELKSINEQLAAIAGPWEVIVEGLL